jgi:hypothetical protein
VTDLIRIPVDNIYDPPHQLKQPQIVITSDIARQIVALAGMDQRIDAIYDSLADRIRVGMDLAKRVAVLESILHHNVKRVLDDDREEQQFPPEARIYDKPHRGLPITPQTFTMPPTQPPANQAKPVDAGPAVDLNAMCEAASDEPYGKPVLQPQVDAAAAIEGLRCVPWGVLAYSTAEAQIAMIRAGKVPGVWYNQEIATEKNALRHEVSQLRTQLAEATSSQSRLEELSAKLNAERDEARAEVERLSKGYHESCIVRAEALQAEVAALKGRKVTLPTNGILRQCGATFYLEELVIKAIRAAGVEVA